MKNFKEFLENYDVYLDKPMGFSDKKNFKATVRVTDKDGKEHAFPIESEDNIRQAAHRTVKELTEKGFKLKDVDYHFD